MAPTSSHLFLAIYEAAICRRDEGGDGATSAEFGQKYTNSQENILQCLALVFSIVSVLSAVLAFYWFVKMRRRFRHDIIMLLIQSDMFKALWFMLYPIVTFAKGPIPDSSNFCRVNGFFLSVGIEASDIAVLMIAVHSALYIFKQNPSGEGGLYPYRRIAYSIWILYPFTMASLAFIDGRDAYSNDVSYCYLPIRPLWYRLALAWVPRYLIFIIILGIYASIFLYVRYKFDGFTRMGRHGFHNSSEGSEGVYVCPTLGDLPRTPPLARHGLIPESRENTIERREPSDLTMETLTTSPMSPTASAHRFIWGNLISPKSNPERAMSEPIPEMVTIPAISTFSSPATPYPVSHFPSPVVLPATPNSNSSASASWNDTFVNRLRVSTQSSPSSRRSKVDIYTALSHRPGHTEPPTPISQLQLTIQLTNSRGQDLVLAEVLRTRETIRRQLRFLFIYPLVYIGMWILPFVSHVLQYDNKFAVNPPFGLTCLTTIFVCSQAAVDCLLFSSREKPWRHIPGNDRSFLHSLRFWTGWKGINKRISQGPGKTRDEMAKEARAAYRRRDEEMSLRRNELNQSELGSNSRGEKNWWEAAGLDGPGVLTPMMSPVPEEHIMNPMDDVVAAGSPTTNGAAALEKTEIPVSTEPVEEKQVTILSEELHGSDTPST